MRGPRKVLTMDIYINNYSSVISLIVKTHHFIRTASENALFGLLVGVPFIVNSEISNKINKTSQWRHSVTSSFANAQTLVERSHTTVQLWHLALSLPKVKFNTFDDKDKTISPRKSFELDAALTNCSWDYYQMFPSSDKDRVGMRLKSKETTSLSTTGLCSSFVYNRRRSTYKHSNKSMTSCKWSLINDKVIDARSERCVLGLCCDRLGTGKVSDCSGACERRGASFAVRLWLLATRRPAKHPRRRGDAPAARRPAVALHFLPATDNSPAFRGYVLPRGPQPQTDQPRD